MIRNASNAMTGFTSATCCIEAKDGGFVASVSCQRLSGKQAAHIVPGLNVGSGIGSAAFSNRVLVHKLDHFNAVEGAFEAIADARAVSAEFQVAQE